MIISGNQGTIDHFELKNATNSKSSLHLHNLLTFSNPISQYKSFSSFANVVFCLSQVSNSFSQNAHFFLCRYKRNILSFFPLLGLSQAYTKKRSAAFRIDHIPTRKKQQLSLSLASIACTKQRRFAFAPKMKRNESIFGQSDQCLISP